MEIVDVDWTRVYERAIVVMYNFGYVVECPDWNTTCKELLNVTLHVPQVYADSPISRYGIHTPEAMRAYRAELLEGSLDWAVHVGKEAYTYHDRMADQWREALDILREGPESRRAVITIRRPEDITMDDQPCLTLIQLLVRQNRLHMITYFRSNDLYEATFMNGDTLIQLQLEWAKQLGISAGSYTHHIGSLHVYEKNFPMFESAANAISCYSRAEWEAMA